MRNFYPILFCILLFNSGGSYALAESDPPSASSSLEKTSWFAKARRQSTAGSNIDVVYHRMNWFLRPDTLYIKGYVVTHFKTVQPNVEKITFNLTSNFTIDSIIFQKKTVNHRFVEPDLLEIDLGVSLDLGVTDSVKIAYKGQPVVSGFESFIVSTHRAGSTQTPVMWTLSEPYGAKEWWPAKQDLNDKIDSVDIIVTTTSSNRVASNGMLVNELTTGNLKTYHWKHRYPIAAYLVAVAITNYEAYSDFAQLQNGQSLEILNYVYPQNLVQSKVETQKIVPVLELYDSIFGLYPFAKEKYGHAQFGWGGGMEHQTMSFMVNFDFGLMSHELAHQWFGNKVTCGSWKDIWLNEGFATYLEGIAYEFGWGDISWQSWKTNKIASITSQNGGALFVEDTTDINRIFSGRLSYSKGAMVLHMLRWIVGDEHFFQACRNYLDDPELTYGYARTDDLRRHMEEQSGKDLKEFFNDWIYGEGFPIYDFSLGGNTDDGHFLVLSQEQSHPSVSFFELPVPIQLKGPDLDTVVVLNHDFSGQQFDLNIKKQIDVVTLDPDFWLITNQRKILGVKDYFSEFGLKVFPNPTKSQLIIQSTKPDFYLKSAKILDYQGRSLVSMNGIKVRGRKEVELDISHLSTGSYVLVLDVNGKEISQKVVKE